MISIDEFDRSLQYCEQGDLSIYKRLLDEIKRSGVDSERLWQSWHGDSHWIADDKLKWKDACPTFHMVLDRLADYFSMDIKVINSITNEIVNDFDL